MLAFSISPITEICDQTPCRCPTILSMTAPIKNPYRPGLAQAALNNQSQSLQLPPRKPVSRP